MKIEHVALYVQDLEKIRVFFENNFGGKSSALYHNQKTQFRSYFISFDDGARLEIMNRPDMIDQPKSPLKTGFVHLAFSVGSKEKVDVLTSKLKQDGYEVLSGPRTTGDGYYESCIRGPEDNILEITE